MTKAAIRADNLSKRYHIVKNVSRYHTLRETISNAAWAPFKRLAEMLRGDIDMALGLEETVWALKNVSFEIEQGEAVGVIGKNGSGKSTLLKIISRITDPTEGCAEINGSIGALLELGAGFHPDLSGRENMYMSGVIRGMKKKELDRKSDEIIAFSGIEKFIDTPIKWYSSGMIVRLGFAVAVHLEPDILLIDEVLAVGDAEFRAKCLKKMAEVVKSGATIMIVSHQTANLTDLCQKAIWLEDGCIRAFGPTQEIIPLYEPTVNPYAIHHQAFMKWLAEKNEKK